MKKIRLLTVLSALICAATLSACGASSLNDNGGDGQDGSDPVAKVYKTEGTYEVGKDIDAAEYLLVCTGNTGGYLTVNLGKIGFLYNESFSGRRYVIVNAGEFLTFEGANLYKLDEAPEMAKATDGGYSPGQYKGGRDIPAGEYLIVDPTDNSLNRIQQLLAPNADFLSSDILFDKTFSYRHYVKIADGQYVSFKYGKLYEAAAAPKIILTGDFYKPGQYKVGADIPAGDYTLSVPEGATSTYEITMLPLCSLLSDAHVANGILAQDSPIRLADGQYIHFDRGRLALNP
ncbi:MAG: hypothetical protein LBP26_04085 [Clostridiales bacterium]|jgi:hypothetical protein|nr:hypothetical protein [Clostridiales bacterium]